MLEWFFQGNDKMHWVAVICTVRRSMFAVLIFLLIRPGTPVYWIGLLECLAVLIGALVGIGVLTLRFRLEFPRVRFSPATLATRIRASIPIGLSELIWAVLWYLPMVQLGLLIGGEQLGWFGASHRIVTAVHTFVWLHLFNILPSISRCADAPKSQLQDLMRRSLMLCAWGSMFVCLLTVLVAGRLMTTAFGDDFSGSGLLLSILIWLIPIALLGGHFRYTLIAYNLQHRDLVAMVVAAVVGISLAFVLTLLYGAIGTACSLIIAKLVQYGLEYYFVSRLIDRIPLVRHLFTPLIAAGVAAAVSLALDRDSLVTVFVAAALYVIIFGLCQARELVSLVSQEWQRRSTNVDQPNGVPAVSSDGSESKSL
jgi:PST family polysaccharide transporter